MQLERCDYNCSCGVSNGERMLRDRIITGVFDKKLQLKLLYGREESLSLVVEICKTFESANFNKDILDARKTVVAVISSEKEERKCPAKNFTCICGKRGNFVRMCQRKQSKFDVNKSEAKQ